MQEFLFYFGLGWDHIISASALDHQLFIAALCAIYTLRDWKQVLILVTAFTIGHSLTLALSVKELISVPSDWVEFLIPCTIVVTAFINLFQKKFSPRSIRINYFLALFFGLIHGMGFANVLKPILASGESFALALLGFNVGLEAGQILVVVLLLLLTKLMLDGFKVNRREWVIFLSAGVFALSLMMVLERLP